MSDFRNISKAEPCPICGKTDWCSIQHTNSGEKLSYCRRTLHGNDITSPLNGRIYVFIKQATDGSCIYKNQEAQEASRQKWLDEHKKGKVSTTQKKQPPVKPPSGVKHCESISPLSNQQLDCIYRSFLSKLRIYEKHLEYLRKERWDSHLIRQSLIRSLPPQVKKYNFDISRTAIAKELIHEFGSLKGVPGFYKDSKSDWTFSGTSGILIPLFDHEGNLYRLRIRLDHPELDEKGKEKNKYKNFSSYYKVQLNDGSFKNALLDGCRAGSHIGFFSNLQKDDYTVCYITEGEKKSMFTNYVLHNPVISLPGVNSFSKLSEQTDSGYTVLDYLRAKGCRTLIIAYDADKAINEAVLMYEKKLIAFLTGYGFQIAVAFWNPGFGKGIDDILSIGVRPNYELVSA